MTEILLLIFELIGTVAFAISGAMIGLAKKMDIFGVVILGTTASVGGGIIRDLVLGNTPPETFKNPVYSIVAIITSILVFIRPIRLKLNSKQHIFDVLLLIMDSLGLAVFTVVGISTAKALNDDYNAYLLLFVGVITGIGGGVVRDVFAQNTPYIFIKHFYAMASIIGAAVCIGLWDLLGVVNSMVIGAALIFLLRIFAAHFHWKLPKAED